MCAANVAVVGELQSLYIQCISLDVSLSTQQEKPCVLPTWQLSVGSAIR